MVNSCVISGETHTGVRSDQVRSDEVRLGYVKSVGLVQACSVRDLKSG